LVMPSGSCTHRSTSTLAAFTPIHQLYVFDLTSPTKSHSTGPRSSKLEEITSLQWNPVVPHILASSSSSGYTSVWDLRGKKEVISLAYGGGAATGMAGGGGGMQVGGRRGMSDICWQPNTVSVFLTNGHAAELSVDRISHVTLSRRGSLPLRRTIRRPSSWFGT
jgi:WD40 repeat protein